MLKTRIIPCLLLKQNSLVKTVKFKKPKYIGDPINTIRIFNELEVDELILLDITATIEKRNPNLKLLSEISNECFMPLSYGGGIRTLQDIKEVFNIGLEKVSINCFAIQDIEFIKKASDVFGSQSIIVSMDIKKNFWGAYEVFYLNGSKKTGIDPVEYAMRLEKAGAGELLLTSIDREGTWAGFDIDLIQKVSNAVSIPVIAHGGAGNIEDIGSAVKLGGASAVALGSMVVYQAKDMGVLINFPDKEKIERILYRN
jgi:cyclase